MCVNNEVRYKDAVKQVVRKQSSHNSSLHLPPARGSCTRGEARAAPCYSGIKTGSGHKDRLLGLVSPTLENPLVLEVHYAP